MADPAKASKRPMPDTVKLSRLNTEFSSSPKYTKHITYVSVNTLERRKIPKEERWKKEGILGRGSYGVVRLERCIHGDNIGKLRAVKRVEKIESLNYHRELEAIALFSNHEHEECFVKSYGWYESNDSIFIAMEYIPNGDLNKYRSILPLLENEGQQIVSQVLEGLDYMHEYGFAHRDLKPANILVVTERPNWWVKIADFGVSKRAIEELTVLKSRAGTTAFAAPEVLRLIKCKSYTNSVDIWSLGVITFLLFTGETPFIDQDRLELYVESSFEFPDTLLASTISEQGCKFVRSLMAPDPKDRPGAKECLQNPWLDNLRTLTIDEPLGTTKTSESQEGLSSYSAEEASARWSALDTDEQTLKTDSRAFTKPPTTISKPENLNPTLLLRNSVNTRISTKISKSQEALSSHSAAEAFARWSTQDQTSRHTLHSSTDEKTLKADSRASSSSSTPVEAEIYSPMEMSAKTTTTSKPENLNPTLTVRNSVNAGILTVLKGHSGEVRSVAFSPDGKLIASASGDKTVRLWDSATGAIRATLEGHSYDVYAMAFSPDGKLIASGSLGTTVGLWDSATGASRATLEGHSAFVTAIAFSPDGKLIASASYDETVRLWDSATGAGRATLKGHSDRVAAIAFSPDGKLIASGSWDKTVRLWDSATGASLATLKGHSKGLKAVAFSTDGKLIASASYDETVRLWDSATGASRATLKGHSAFISAIAFSPDGKLIASASYDETVRLWDSATGASRATLEGHSNYVTAIAFSPDGKLIASGSWDKTVRLWDSATGVSRATLWGHSDYVCKIAFSPDGKLIASGSDDMTVRVWGAILPGAQKNG